jgi:hypothetical protein
MGLGLYILDTVILGCLLPIDGALKIFSVTSNFGGISKSMLKKTDWL